MKRARLWIRLALFLLVLAGSGFAWRQMRRTRELTDLPTAAVRKGDFLVLVRCRGELTARRSEQVTAPLDVPDLQIVWLAPERSAVKAGQTIIQFDPSRTQQDLKEKKAALTQAQATWTRRWRRPKLPPIRTSWISGRRSIRPKRRAWKPPSRAIVSAIQGQESDIDLGLAQEKLKVQQAAHHAAQEIGRGESRIARTARDAAKAQVELTKHQLALMEMKSPLDGVINYLLNYSQGWNNAQAFKVGDHAVAGGALAEIPDLSTLEMESKVDETDRGRIAVGDNVLVHVDALPELTLTANWFLLRL